MSDENQSLSDEDGMTWGMPKYSEDDSSVETGYNMTDEEFLEKALGPKQVGIYILIPITVIYVIMFVTGVFGNFAVCFVIVRIKSMHTATNYYLLSLAAADLIILIFGLPNELFGFWHQYPYLQGEFFCKFRSYLSELASYASVLTIVSFSLERYLAICHPLHIMYLGDFQRASRVLGICWTVASLSAIPYLIFTRINYVDFPLGSGRYIQDSAFCALLDINIVPKNYPIHEVSTIFFFFFPVCILTYLYTRMAIKLRGSFGSNVGQGSAHGNREVNSNRKQIIRMLGKPNEKKNLISHDTSI